MTKYFSADRKFLVFPHCIAEGISIISAISPLERIIREIDLQYMYLKKSNVYFTENRNIKVSDPQCGKMKRLLSLKKKFRQINSLVNSLVTIFPQKLREINVECG